jgi:hypothetical protein
LASASKGRQIKIWQMPTDKDIIDDSRRKNWGTAPNAEVLEEDSDDDDDISNWHLD